MTILVLKIFAFIFDGIGEAMKYMWRSEGFYLCLPSAGARACPATPSFHWRPLNRVVSDVFICGFFEGRGRGGGGEVFPTSFDARVETKGPGASK